MQTIDIETTIAAPPERCFLLSLSIDLHKASAAVSNEEAIAGITSGLIGLGQTVTFRGRHFGLYLTHTSLITFYDRPNHFQDRMTKGVFKSFTHDHYFSPTPDGKTLMRDVLRFTAPLGPLGRLAELVVLRRYLGTFLEERNRLLQRIAESPTPIWEGFTRSK